MKLKNIVSILLLFIFLVGCNKNNDNNIPENKDIFEYVYENSYEMEELNIDTELNKPKGIVSDRENLYICDSENDRILKTSFDGKIIKEFNLDGGFSKPECITINEGDLYIYDRDNFRIVVLNNNGDIINEFNLMQLIDEHKFDFSVIDLEPISKDEIYISVLGFDRIAKKSGIYLLKDGKAELILKDAMGNFTKDKSGNIFFIDEFDRRSKDEVGTGQVSIFKINGSDVIELEKVSNFYTSIDIVDFNNKLYVYDSARHNIDVFSYDGTYEKTIFSNYMPPEVVNITGFCVDKDGNFYISDSKNNKIFKVGI